MQMAQEFCICESYVLFFALSNCLGFESKSGFLLFFQVIFTLDDGFRFE